ncbi:hypothetical protein CFP65_1214 [Kitasatospora sp. MMS16-BH015]|uniref:transposase n=1 Tax=Kitasatospora sp. MMS16-BH015 TaxID=2018025 RepID=UPI000CA106FC|nr:transposase [Kitasatospora sp. MMS16-BH015]AUG76117.1 hypothetical protein CFP65_1214 [Kitasatospora sp. MMS16-BH015]
MRIVAETGKPAAEFARELGINEVTLATWVSRARKAGGDGTLGESECEKLARLRQLANEQARCVRELEMERAVLKRRMVLWAK